MAVRFIFQKALVRGAWTRGWESTLEVVFTVKGTRGIQKIFKRSSRCNLVLIGYVHEEEKIIVCVFCCCCFVFILIGLVGFYTCWMVTPFIDLREGKKNERFCEGSYLV